MRLAVIAAAALLAGPALAQDTRTWTFAETEEGAHLSYGTPESDDLPIAFHCQKGTGEVSVFLVFEHREATEAPNADGEWVNAKGEVAPWKTTLVIGTSSGDFKAPASVEADEMNGGSSIEVTAGVGDPPFVAISRDGKMTFKAYGETVSPPTAPKAEFRKLLRLCKG